MRKISLNLKQITTYFLGGLWMMLVFTYCTTKESVQPNNASQPLLNQKAGVSNNAAGTGQDIMLQGFHWNTWQYGTWNILKNQASNIKNAGFTMVWFPPVSRSTGGTGYLPNEWYNINSDHGSGNQLRDAVSALKSQNVKAIADIVINHRVGTTNWADFSNPSFANNARAVTQDDEWGQGTGNHDSGDSYNAGRDLDHTYSSVRNEVKNWLRNNFV